MFLTTFGSASHAVQTLLDEELGEKKGKVDKIRLVRQITSSSRRFKEMRVFTYDKRTFQVRVYKDTAYKGRLREITGGNTQGWRKYDVTFWLSVTLSDAKSTATYYPDSDD